MSPALQAGVSLSFSEMNLAEGFLSPLISSQLVWAQYS